MTKPDLFHRVYDALFQAKDYAGEADRVLALGGIAAAGARLLEIGAGTGNHTLALARRGHHVCGVEIDPQMATVFRQKLASADRAVAERIRLFEGRVEAFESGDFDLAMALFNVISYVASLADLRSLLGAVRQRLVSGGAFVFDAWNGVAVLSDPPRPDTRIVDAPDARITVRLDAEMDRMALTARLRYRLLREPYTGEPERDTCEIPHALWPPKIVVETAREAGFDTVTVHPAGDLTRPATARDWKVLYQCR